MPLYQLYARQIGVDPAARVKELQIELAEAQKQATKMKQSAQLAKLPAHWSNYFGGPYKPDYEVDTGLSVATVAGISDQLTTYPRQFHIHAKIKKLLEQRREMGHGARPFDYGMAEAVAFGSLLLEGTPVRLSGQDSQRGTFNQRHSVLVDIENEQHYVPLENLGPQQARFEVYNSILSEAGCWALSTATAATTPTPWSSARFGLAPAFQQAGGRGDVREHQAGRASAME